MGVAGVVARGAAADPREFARGTLYVDPRVGSKELAPLISRHGIRTTLASPVLQAGDFAWRCGHTEPSPYCDATPTSYCRVAVERKTLGDLVGSLMSSRISGQVADLLTGYTMSWVVVEGIWRAGADDGIEVWGGGGHRRGEKRDHGHDHHAHAATIRRGVRVPGVTSDGWIQARGSLTYSALSGWLTHYVVFGGGRISEWRTSSKTETAAWVAAQFRWWQKEWKRHHRERVEKIRLPRPDRALIFRPTEMQQVALALPGIGGVKAKKVGRFFESIEDMMTASVEEWREAGLGKAEAVAVRGEIVKQYRKREGRRGERWT